VRMRSNVHGRALREDERTETIGEAPGTNHAALAKRQNSLNCENTNFGCARRKRFNAVPGLVSEQCLTRRS